MDDTGRNISDQDGNINERLQSSYDSRQRDSHDKAAGQTLAGRNKRAIKKAKYPVGLDWKTSRESKCLY